jgi:hypothetical protein
MKGNINLNVKHTRKLDPRAAEHGRPTIQHEL